MEYVDLGSVLEYEFPAEEVLHCFEDDVVLNYVNDLIYYNSELCYSFDPEVQEMFVHSASTNTLVDELWERIEDNPEILETLNNRKNGLAN